MPVERVKEENYSMAKRSRGKGMGKKGKGAKKAVATCTKRQARKGQPSFAEMLTLVASVTMPRLAAEAAGGGDPNEITQIVPALPSPKRFPFPSERSRSAWKRVLERLGMSPTIEDEVDLVLDEKAPKATVMMSAALDPSPSVTDTNWPPVIDPSAQTSPEEDSTWQKDVLEAEVQSATVVVVEPDPVRPSRARTYARRIVIGIGTTSVILATWLVLATFIRGTPEATANHASDLICEYGGECSADQITYTPVEQYVRIPRYHLSEETLVAATSGSRPGHRDSASENPSGDIAVLESELVKKRDVLERTARRTAHHRTHRNNRTAIIALQHVLDAPVLSLIIKSSACDATKHMGHYDWQTRCEVRSLQRWARSHGYRHIIPDGAVGPETVKLIRSLL